MEAGQGEQGQGAFLRAGIAAFKQGQHTLAIQHLQLAETDSRGDELLQVQGWLVRAYSQARRYGEARDVCETLTRCDRPSVQAWARQVLDQLPPPEPSPEVASPPPPQIRRPESPDLEFNAPVPPIRDRAIPRAPATVSPSQRPALKPRSRDLTPLVLSAIAHGSISPLGSLLLWLLFPESTLATLLGMTRLVIPMVIFLTTEDPLAKENGREATNYALTSIVLGGVAIVGAIPAAIAGVGLFNTSPGLLVLLAVPLVGYAVLLSLSPLIATFYCCLKGGQVARYPNWLILRVV